MRSGPPSRSHQDEVKGSLGSGLLGGWRFWSTPLRCWQNLGLFLAGSHVLGLHAPCHGAPLGVHTGTWASFQASWVGLPSTLHSDLQILPEGAV